MSQLPLTKQPASETWVPYSLPWYSPLALQVIFKSNSFRLDESQNTREGQMDPVNESLFLGKVVFGW